MGRNWSKMPPHRSTSDLTYENQTQANDKKIKIITFFSASCTVLSCTPYREIWTWILWILSVLATLNCCCCCSIMEKHHSFCSQSNDLLVVIFVGWCLHIQYSMTFKELNRYRIIGKGASWTLFLLKWLLSHLENSFPNRTSRWKGRSSTFRLGQSWKYSN